MENDQFDFRTGNGKPPGNKGGRPTKDFIEAKKAIEAFGALEGYFGGEFLASLLSQSNGNNKARGKGYLGRNLEELKSSVFTAAGTEAVGLASIPLLLFAWYQAEENIKNMPQILHLVQEVLWLLLPLLKQLIKFLGGSIEEFTSELKADYKESHNGELDSNDWKNIVKYSGVTGKLIARKYNW